MIQRREQQNPLGLRLDVPTKKVVEQPWIEHPLQHQLSVDRNRSLKSEASMFFVRAGMRSLNSPEFRKRLNSGEFSYDKHLIPARAKNKWDPLTMKSPCSPSLAGEYPRAPSS